jgi:uncharacterized protein (DUF433 family)
MWLADCFVKRRRSMGMLNWSHCSSVERSANKMSGAWLFRGTCVPVKSLFENIEDGASVDDFLEWSPGVGREHIVGMLEFHEQSLTAS